MKYSEFSTNFKKVKWNTEPVLTLPADIRSATFSPCGEVIVYGDVAGSLHLLKISDTINSSSKSILLDKNSTLHSIAVNPTSDLIAAASNSAKIYICQLDPNQASCSQPLANLPSSLNKPISVGFVEDLSNGQNMLLIGSRKNIRIVDAESGKVFRELNGKGGTAIVESFNACFLAAGSLEESTVSFWDIRSPLPVGQVSTKLKKKSIFSIDSGKHVVALAGDAGVVHFFDMRNYKPILKKQIGEDSIKSLRFTPKYRTLAASFQNEVRLIDINEMALGLKPLPTNNIALASPIYLRWNPNSASFYVIENGKNLRHLLPQIIENEQD